MAIILNVKIILIWSGSKATTYSNKCQSHAHCLKIHAHCLKIYAHCLLNMCKVLELSHQVCQCTIKRKWGKHSQKRSHLDGL